MYGTGMFFNIERLLKKRFPQFRPYYMAINQERLKEVILEHFEELGDTRFIARLRAIMNRFQDSFEGIGLRDLANILFHLYHREREYEETPSESLPPVAKYRLGMPEPKPTGKGPSSKTRSKGKEYRRYEDIPLLNQIVEFKPKAYLLTPGYSGRLPTDAPVYIPAAVASIYSNLPKGIIPVGDERLKWGDTPIINARRALAGLEIVILE
jgi:hypothetical protein